MLLSMHDSYYFIQMYCIWNNRGGRTSPCEFIMDLLKALSATKKKQSFLPLHKDISNRDHCLIGEKVVSTELVITTCCIFGTLIAS